MRNKKKASVLRPSKAFSECPACRTKNLIRLEVDVVCGECDWDSTEAFVESGGMDNLFAAHRDHFVAPFQTLANEREQEGVTDQENIQSVISVEMEETEEFFKIEAIA